MKADVPDGERVSLRLKVHRRGANDHPLARYAATHHAGLGDRLSGANGKIKTILCQVRKAVCQRQVKLQTGVSPEQLRQDRYDAMAAKMHRGRRTQSARGSIISLVARASAA